MYIGGTGTSTIQSNLYVMGTLRSAVSYNGDLIFANNFRITEAADHPGLLFNNSANQTVLSLDESGVAEVREIKAEKIEAEKALLNGLEMRDKVTGEIYCTWIANGDWQKTKGECSKE